MTQSPEEINIYAYLVPHPLDEDSETEPEFLEWIPGFLNEDDDEEGVIAIWRDSNVEIYNKIESLTEQYFKDSVKTMWPLLSEFYINSMQVAIDISGMMGSTNTSLAGYLYHRSNLIKGNYVFQLDLNLLLTYLKKDEKNEALDFHEKSIWEHELIHLIDHSAITVASIYMNSKSPFENFKYYLIKYREEGIADLYYVLNGHTKISNVQEAIEKFKDAAINRKKELDFSIQTTDKIRTRLYEGMDFYYIGPWLILEILREMEANWEMDTITSCIETISKKEAVPLETILEVVKKAILIEPTSFLYYVEEYFEEDFVPMI